MNYRTLGGNDLADFAENVKDLLIGTKLSNIDSNVRADLVTSLGTMPSDLDTLTGAAFIAEDERKAAISARNDMRSKVTALMSQVRDALKAGLAPKEQYDLCGFDYPSPTSASYTANDPTDLSVFGYSNGVISGRFRGNNVAGRVTYEIWRRQGDEGPWGVHITTRRQSFNDSPVIPGQYYEYKVRAVAARTTSYFSNSAVVYGVA